MERSAPVAAYPDALAAPAATTPTAGVYLHVPFCARLCPYCDFDTQDRELHLIAPFASALVREVALTPRLAASCVPSSSPTSCAPAASASSSSRTARSPSSATRTTSARAGSRPTARRA